MVAGMPDTDAPPDDDDLFAEPSGSFTPTPEHDAAVAAALYRRAVGGVTWTEKVDRGEIVRLHADVPADVTAAKMWLQARQPQAWGERRQDSLQVVVVRIEGKPESARSVIEHDPDALALE